MRMNASFPHADLALQMIGDIGPELALRWLAHATVECQHLMLSPALYRALVSLTLRATTPGDMHTAADVHDLVLSRLPPVEAAASAPAPAPAENFHADGSVPTPAVLGFTSKTTQVVFTNVLLDLLQSAARDDPLLVEGPALMFYREAGPGTADSKEFNEADMDHRAAFCTSTDPLDDVRRLGLARVLHLFAHAVRIAAARDSVLAAADRNLSHFLAPLVDALPANIHRLHPHIVTAVQAFYAAFLAVAPEAALQECTQRITNTVMKLAQDRPCSVAHFLTTLKCPRIVQSVTRASLIQRFAVVDTPNRPLTTSALIDKYLALDIVLTRNNAILHALLTALISSWVQSAPQNAFQFTTQAGALQCLRKLSHLIDKLRLPKPTIPSRDLQAFRLAVWALADRITTTTCSTAAS